MKKFFKVAYISTGLATGGSEKMLKRLIVDTSEPPESVLVISLTDLGSVGRELVDSGYQVQCLNMKGLSQLFSTILKLSKVLKEYNPDVVHTWMYHADLIGGLAAKLAGIKNVVWGVRCTVVPIGNRSTYFVMKICAILSSIVPKEIVCVAEAARKQHAIYGYNKKKLTVIRNGYNFQPFEKVASEGSTKKASKSKFIVGCVGRFHPDKGQDILLEAIPSVIKNNQDVHFFFVGPGCDITNQEITGLIDSLGISGYVTLLGERSDIPELLATFDCYCMPSRSEGFPNALAEAMISKLVCVATDVGDSRFLLDGHGILVHPDSTAELASGILSVLNLSDQERSSLRQKAFDSVRSKYSIDAIKAQYQQLYRRIM